MPEVLTIAVIVVAGAPAAEVAALAGALFLPAPLAAVGLVVLGGTAFRSPAPYAVSSEAAYLRTVSAELRGGTVLRSALIAGAVRVPDLGMEQWVRRAAAGQPMSDLARRLAEHLPGQGWAARAAVDLLDEGGGNAAEIFEQLATQADRRDEVRREVAAATAQARLSAIVVGGAPALLTLGLMVRGNLTPLLSTTAGKMVLFAGLALQLVGMASVAVLSRRAAP